MRRAPPASSPPSPRSPSTSPTLADLLDEALSRARAAGAKIGATQAAEAELLGVSPSYLSKLRNGKAPITEAFAASFAEKLEPSDRARRRTLEQELLRTREGWFSASEDEPAAEDSLPRVVIDFFDRLGQPGSLVCVDYRDLPEASHPDNLLIHHFSIGSRASRVAYALPDRMALVYHNITPPEFFVDVHPLLVQLCYLGRRELGVYANRVELGLGDSEYNRAELEALGFPHTAVLPVVPDFSHLAGPPNFMQAGAFDDDWVNILFVGRMIPNKRIEDVVRAFHAYKRWFNPRSRLLLVGSHGGFGRGVPSDPANTL